MSETPKPLRKLEEVQLEYQNELIQQGNRLYRKHLADKESLKLFKEMELSNTKIEELNQEGALIQQHDKEQAETKAKEEVSNVKAGE